MSLIGNPLVPAIEATPRTGTGKPKQQYIDCLRGYAVLMVITCHTTYAYPLLPYVVHRIGAFGWHGVQLFFLASCLTLMMSSAYEQTHTGRMFIGNFFIRRFLRIAPMYYAAGIFYLIAASTSGANAIQALSAVLFMNAWHPVTMPTVGSWQLVPGGWSIGVEFTFYFLFPLFFATITSLKRAGWLFVISVLTGAILNSLLINPLTNEYGSVAAENFLYFWFFGQAPVFAMGSIVFFLIKGIEADAAAKTMIRGFASTLIALTGLISIAIAVMPVHFGEILKVGIALPQYLAASTIFAAAIVVFSQAGKTVFINPSLAGLGKVSFSAYLLHFAIIEWILKRHADIFHLMSTGWSSIAWFALGLIAVWGTTYLASLMTYSWIELPMMRMAKFLTRKYSARSRAA